MGKKSCEKGKLMQWNAPSHDDMLTWLSLCKNVSLLVASHSILLADTVASLSLLGVLRPPGPRGPPPAARRSTLPPLPPVAMAACKPISDSVCFRVWCPPLPGTTSNGGPQPWVMKAISSTLVFQLLPDCTLLPQTVVSCAITLKLSCQNRQWNK